MSARGIPGRNEPIGVVTVSRERQSEIFKRLLDCPGAARLTMTEMAFLSEHVAIMIAADIERARIAQASGEASREPSCEASKNSRAEALS